MTYTKLREKSRETYQKADAMIDAALARGYWNHGELDLVSEIQDAANWLDVAAGQLYEAEQKKWGAA